MLPTADRMSFLKRATKRDVAPTSSAAATASATSAPRSIRFSSLGATDYDLFEDCRQPSPPKQSLDVGDKEIDIPQEALLANFDPPDHNEVTAELNSVSEAIMCPPARQASISAPPEVQFEDNVDDGTELELSLSCESSSSGGRKEAKKTVESCDLLDDIDKTFDSVPKPASKPRKPPSAYVKPKAKVSVARFAGAPAAPESLDAEESEPEEAEKPIPIRDSIFDREEPAFEAELAAAMAELPPGLEEPPPPPPSPPSSLPAEPAPDRLSSSSSTPLAPTPPPSPLPSVPRPESDPTAVLLDRRMLAGAAVFATLVAVRLIPSASFVLGFLWGGIVALAGAYLYRLLHSRSAPRERFSSVPELRDLPPPVVPHIAEEGDDGGGVFRGWLNELNVYLPDSYHINQTYSVFVSLDGTQLRIQRPRQNVPKRAMWNEALPAASVNFVHQRHFDMMGARVTLEPGGLVRKRVWSKKYPICIELPAGNVVGAKPRPAKPQQPQHEDFEWLDAREAASERFFFFARTCREKEEWFRRFEAAAKGKPLQLSLQRIVRAHLEEDRSSVFAPAGGEAAAQAGSVSFSQLGGGGGSSSGEGGGGGGLPGLSEAWRDRLPGKEREALAVTYTRYMARFMPADWLTKAAKSHRLSINYVSCDPQVLWLNAILGRGVWDFLREKFWADTVKQKIQNKLRKIHLPYFIDELSVVEISLGQDFPVIRRAGKPFLDRRGLWVELEIAYCGGSSMALETKVNLMKLRRPKHEVSEVNKSPAEAGTGTGAATGSPPTASAASAAAASRASGTTEAAPPRRHHQARTGAFCSEEEDSAESTTDSELDENPEADIVTDPDKGNHIGGGTSRKLLRFVDRISRSSYFHKAIENKFIQRGMEYVSNTRIVLHVEVRGLSGTLMVNIPPPPTDRLWYGFKPCPKLILAARPKVGAKELTMNRLTEWIEKKLELEFQRIFVLPNMDDMVVPLLLSGNPECAHHPEATSFSKS